jgi:hypothetical protein
MSDHAFNALFCADRNHAISRLGEHVRDGVFGARGDPSERSKIVPTNNG